MFADIAARLLMTHKPAPKAAARGPMAADAVPKPSSEPGTTSGSGFGGKACAGNLFLQRIYRHSASSGQSPARSPRCFRCQEQLVQPRGGMIGDAAQDVGELSLWKRRRQISTSRSGEPPSLLALKSHTASRPKRDTEHGCFQNISGFDPSPLGALR
jgi:hypothetical protein